MAATLSRDRSIRHPFSSAKTHKTNRSRSNDIKPYKHKKSRTNKQAQGLQEGLAICLLGFSKSMYCTEYDEEIRKRAVMAEVLPDDKMWKRWEESEAQMRKGRGWYPALDRHFLELLVISEIQCLGHPLDEPSAIQGETDRIHRHASRVRRVASERIGADRLRAYRDRVKEAFDHYVNTGWGAQRMVRGGGGDSSDEDSDLGTDLGEVGLDKDVIIGSGEDEYDDDLDKRGRAEERRKADNLERSERPEKAVLLNGDQPGARSLSREREEGSPNFDPFSDTIDVGMVNVDLERVHEVDEPGSGDEAMKEIKLDPRLAGWKELEGIVPANGGADAMDLDPPMILNTTLPQIKSAKEIDKEEPKDC